jgi:hypothetical protein
MRWWLAVALGPLLGCGDGAPRAREMPDAAPGPDAPAPDAPMPGAASPLATTVVRPPADRSLQDLHCALSRGGDGIAVWRETDADFQSQVWSARLTRDGQTWQPPLQVGARPAAQVDGPLATIDDEARALAVWNETGTATAGVVAARGLPATGWDTPAVISAGWVTTLVGTPAGAAVAHGVVEGKPPTLLRYLPASGWLPDAALHLDHDGTLFAAPSGAALLAWNTPTPAGQALSTSDYLQGTWTPPTILQAARPLTNPLPIVDGALTDGSALLLWNRGGEIRGELWAATRNGAPWDPPMMLDDGEAPLWTTHVALSGSNAVVVWETGDAPARKVHAAVRIAGGWQPSPTLGAGSELTAVGITPTGTAVVAWSTPGGVFARLYTPSTGWSAPSAWLDDLAGVASLCAGIDARGRAWLLWIGQSPQLIRAALIP